jgi:tripartite-type tricarboxylate transporter receptor subunit TctC
MNAASLLPLAAVLAVAPVHAQPYPSKTVRLLVGYSPGGGTDVLSRILAKSYDPIRDFTAIGLIATSPNAFVVHPSLPVKSVRELIALARSISRQDRCTT